MSLKVAVLGPLGTYTHEAAHKRFGSHAEYLEQETIKGVFDGLTSTDVGVVPQENSIFGSVVETYDVLREAGFVYDEVTLQVQHCLLVRRGVQLNQIRKILSHEQALGQCKKFIAKHLPSATLVKTTSTAAAARALLDNPPDCAAICSRVCASLYDDLLVLQEGIQDITKNFTRFYVVVRAEQVERPQWLAESQPCRALIRITTRPRLAITTSPKVEAAGISNLLSALQMNVIRIDRRPSLEPTPFHDVYFVEIIREDGTSDGGCTWRRETKMALKRIEEAGGNARLIGFW